MKKFLILVLLGVIAWHFQQKFRHQPDSSSAAPLQVQPAPTINALVADTAQHFTCDGRTHCSQMHSCEEATYFLNHCPGVKMDGNHDGVPCEKQHCR
jgi:hypothetical protein